MFGLNPCEITLDLNQEESEKVRAEIEQSVVAWCPRCDQGNDHIISYKPKECSHCGYPELKAKI